MLGIVLEERVMQKCMPLGYGFLSFNLCNKIFFIKLFTGLCNVPAFPFTTGTWSGLLTRKQGFSTD